MANVVRTKGAEIIFREDLILQINYDEIFLTLEDSKNIFKVTRENCPWDKSPVYLTGGGFTNQDAESRKYHGSEEVTKHCSAIAFLSDSLAQRIMANFFMTVIRPKVPTKAFSSEQSAIEWLKKFETIFK